MAIADEHDARALAAGHSRFRDSNERLRQAAGRLRFEATDRAPFICECADPDCYRSLMLSLEEYDRVRAEPCRFVLARGHEGPETNNAHVVEDEPGYMVIETTGLAGAEAARLHHRRAQRTTS